MRSLIFLWFQYWFEACHFQRIVHSHFLPVLDELVLHVALVIGQLLDQAASDIRCELLYTLAYAKVLLFALTAVNQL